jgi:putative Mn2+ efflux pump MntP
MSGNASRSRILYHLARADFLERVRRYSFLVTLAFALYLGYLAATGQIFLNLGKYQAVYNAAYVGGFMSYISAVFLTLAGFYMVKNAIDRDRKTRVGQILAACSMRKTDYCLGKFLSNLCVLGLMVAVLAAAGVAMYFLHGDKPGFHPFPLLATFIVFAAPAVAFTAAMAVLFEAVPVLSGGLGNVIYFFAWNGLLLLGAAAILTGHDHPFLDLTGGFSLWHSMAAALTAAFPGAVANSFALTVAGEPNPTIGVFRWNGFSWTAVLLLSRVFWVGLAFAVTYAGAAVFDRFQAASTRERKHASDNGSLPSIDTARVQPEAHLKPATLTPVKSRFRFGAVFAAEMRLMFKGQRWWWYVAAAGLAVSSGAVVSREGRGIVLAFAWIWPLFLWSSLGVRESRDQTSQLIFSTPHPLLRQLPAIWLSGFALAMLTGSGFALRLLLAGDLAGLRVWAIGALFIPTFALALGVWSGGGKLFEMVYFFLWYLGPVHSIAPLDFMGAAPVTVHTQYPMFYLALTGALAIAAVVGRQRQLQT